jgi:hypothetical protein
MAVPESMLRRTRRSAVAWTTRLMLSPVSEIAVLLRQSAVDDVAPTTRKRRRLYQLLASKQPCDWVE